MDLKKKLDSIKKTETLYITLGILLVAVTAVGFQYQDSAPKTEENQIQVSLTLEKPNATVQKSVSVGVNSTVFDALNNTYPIEYTAYDFGHFVTSIDGLEQNETHSWLYYVNNKSATKAVNNYVLESDDAVEFRYTSNTPQ